MKITQIIQELNRYEREKMKGASAEAIASERTKRRFGRDVPGTEAARQKMHPKGEQRGGPGRKGVNTSGRTGSDPLAKREPKGNAPVTSAEAGPRKRETRRLEFLKTKVNLPEPKVKNTPKPRKKKSVKEATSLSNLDIFNYLLNEYKKGSLHRAVKDAIRGGANPEKVKKEGLAGEEVREKGAKFRGKGAAKGFDIKMKKSHLPPKDSKLMRQGLKMEQTEIEEAKIDKGLTPLEKKLARAKRFREDPERILIRTDGTPARRASHKMLRGVKRPDRMMRKALRDEMPDEKDMKYPYK